MPGLPPARSASSLRRWAITLHCMAQFPYFRSSSKESDVPSTYDKLPFVNTGLSADVCLSGWNQIASEIVQNRKSETFVVCVECYPGTLDAEIVAALTSRLTPSTTVHASDAYRSETVLKEMFDRDLTSDPVFGRVSDAGILDFFDPSPVSYT